MLPKAYLSIPIYIYRGWLIYNRLFLSSCATKLFSDFQSPNSRSKPLDVISILKCAWRPNFTFFGIFLLYIKPLWKSLIQWSRKFYCFLLFTRICDFQSSLINSKKIPKNVKFGLQAHLNIFSILKCAWRPKIPKNVKFGLQAHFNMEKILSGSDRLFGFSNWNTSVK